MENHFNFFQSPEITALKHALALMPGLKQVDLIVINDSRKDVDVYRLKEKSTELTDVSLDETQISDTFSFSAKQKNLCWYQNTDIPYLLKGAYKNDKNDLFSELDNNVLSVPIRNFATIPDLIYLFAFRKNASELGPVSSRNILDTSHKQLLGRLLSNSLKAMIQSIFENRKVMLEYNNMLGSIIKSKDSEIEKHKEKQSDVEQYLDQILFNYINDLKLPKEEIILGEGVKEMLYPYLSDFDYVKSQINKALNFARTFNFLKNTPQLELLSEYFTDLKDIKPEKNKTKEVNNDIYSTHTKTYQFLQYLEEAAIRILEKGEKLTSNNVGQELEHPVTAAAISDKLKNHSYKIHLLLNQFPEKWSIVRNQFKPIINIIEKQSQEKFAS